MEDSGAANTQHGLKTRFKLHGENEIRVVGRSRCSFAEKPPDNVLKQCDFLVGQHDGILQRRSADPLNDPLNDPKHSTARGRSRRVATLTLDKSAGRNALQCHRFRSGFITTYAFLSLIGLVGTIFWLLYAKKPVVDVHELKDKNFALGSVCVVGFAAILYGSAVLVPQLAQQQLGYTATLAGLVSSLGAMMIAAIIPAVSKLMPIIQTRYLVGFGFFLTACALFYKHPLLPNIDGKTLAIMRSSQSIAIAFLPITTLAYLTLKASENADASAFFHNVPQRGGALRRRAKKRWYLGRRGCGYSVRTRAINASNWA